MDDDRHKPWLSLQGPANPLTLERGRHVHA